MFVQLIYQFLSTLEVIRLKLRTPIRYFILLNTIYYLLQRYFSTYLDEYNINQTYFKPIEDFRQATNFDEILLIIDFIHCLDWILGEEKNQARWYILHTIINAVVVIYTFHDMFSVLRDPITSIKTPASRIPINLTVALHYYHMIFFNYLYPIDWIHHILMMYVAFNVYYNPEVGLVSNYIIFFINGLPGGFDYLMLVLVKYNLIKSYTEKKINSYVNIWIRSPGILIGTYCLYLASIVQQNYNPYFLDRFSILGLLFWNAQYFTYRVIYNYAQRTTENSMMDGRDRTIKKEFTKALVKLVRSKSMGDLQKEEGRQVDEKENNKNNENQKEEKSTVARKCDYRSETTTDTHMEWREHFRRYSQSVLSIFDKSIQNIRKKDIQRIEKEEKASRESFSGGVLKLD